MSVQHVNYLIIGTGPAGFEAARTIRERDRAGSIVLLGQESVRPYDRRALSGRYLKRSASRSDLSIAPVGWFTEQQIELHTGSRVSAIDANRRGVTLASGQAYVGDTVLIATGATARALRIPGADLPNVFALRTLDEADRLLNALDKARQVGRATPNGRGRVVIIGAGVLGPELAGTLAEMGHRVELIVGGPHPWWKFAGETIGRFARRVLNDVGVVVHENVRAERIEGDGRAQRVVLADGQTVGCELVISATGAIPNRDLLRGTPIDAEKAILTDAQARTNVDRIFAAGDCAAIFDPLFGKHRIIDHWPHAIATGRLAGANMAAVLGHGPTLSFAGASGFETSLPGHTLVAFGEPRKVDHRLVRGSGNAIAEIGVDTDGRVAFVCSVGRADETAALQQLVSDRRDIRGMEESLKDPEVSIG